MTPKINQRIARQAFEVVGEQIGAILSAELASQHAMASDDDRQAVKAHVWKERFVPFDKTELPAVNITFDRVDYSEQSQRQTNGTNVYHIDCYSAAKDSHELRGDQQAKIRLHRLMGVCRAILEDPRYKRLGINYPLIMHRRITSMAIASPDTNDSLALAMGRLTLEVKFPETTAFITPDTLFNHETTVKLHETEKGYLYIFNQ